jgi:hypothetical protein
VMVPLVTEAEKQKRRQKVREKRRASTKPRRPLAPRKPGADLPFKEFKTIVFYDERGEHWHEVLARCGRLKAGARLRREADRLGFAKADERVANVDGASWIRRQLLEQPKQLPLDGLGLDFYHLSENVHKARRAVFGEDDAAGKTWVAELLHTLKHEGYAAAWERCVAWRAALRGAAKRKAADRLLNYMAERRDMVQYPEFAARGWQIGSGPTESRCKTSTSRLKGRGRRWNGTNAEAVAALTTLKDSGQPPASQETGDWLSGYLLRRILLSRRDNSAAKPVPRRSSRIVSMSIKNSPWWRTISAVLVAAGVSFTLPALLHGEPPVAEKDPPKAESKEGKPAETAPAATKPTDEKASDKKTPEQREAERQAAKKAAEKFLRIVRDKAGEPTSMQTSIVSYKPKGDDRKGLVVDLIGAVHVGDGDYYDKLNKAFKEYDVVLYELVAPEGTKIPKGGRTEGSGHPVGAIQVALKDILDLEFQLEKVDYTPKNFVHADMSPEEFSKTMEERGESFLQMFFKMMGASIAQQAGKKGGGSSDAEILFALFSPDRSFKLKRVMAQQFEDLGGTMSMIEGPKGSTIIGERNRKAFEVLKKEIAAGKKKIGVFYGAGHLPDMEKRLTADFQLHPGDVKWIDAWDLRQKKSRR